MHVQMRVWPMSCYVTLLFMLSFAMRMGDVLCHFAFYVVFCNACGLCLVKLFCFLCCLLQSMWVMSCLCHFAVF